MVLLGIFLVLSSEQLHVLDTILAVAHYQAFSSEF